MYRIGVSIRTISVRRMRYDLSTDHNRLGGYDYSGEVYELGTAKSYIRACFEFFGFYERIKRENAKKNFVSDVTDKCRNESHMLEFNMKQYFDEDEGYERFEEHTFYLEKVK